MTAPYDNRRFRTTQPMTIPAGTLVLPSADGTRGQMNDGTATPLVASFPLDEALRLGVIRQLADGQA
jgi:hypothetical protein